MSNLRTIGLFPTELLLTIHIDQAEQRKHTVSSITSAVLVNTQSHQAMHPAVFGHTSQFNSPVG